MSVVVLGGVYRAVVSSRYLGIPGGWVVVVGGGGIECQREKSHGCKALRELGRDRVHRKEGRTTGKGKKKEKEERDARLRRNARG